MYSKGFAANIFAQLQRNQEKFLQSTPEINADGFIVLQDGRLAHGAGDLLRNLATQPTVLKSKIEKINKDKCLALVKEKATHNGNTALHCAAATPDSLKILLDVYPSSECLEAIGEKNSSKRTVLHEAISNATSLAIILALYSGDNQKQLMAVQEKDEDNNTVLHLAAAYPPSFQMLWALYPKEQRFFALEQKNNKGETALHLAVTSRNTTPEFLESILQSYPEKTLLAAIKAKNAEGANVLSLAINRPELLKVIITSLSKDELWQIIKDNTSSYDFLHRHKSSKNLSIILERFSDSDRLALVLNKNPSNKTLLESLGADLRAMQSVLKAFPVASNWIIEGKDGKLELLPVFKTENPAQKIAEMLTLYNNIKQLANCGNSSASLVAERLTQQLDEFVLTKGTDAEREAQIRQEFASEVREGYKNLRTQGEYIGAFLINIALAATIVGFPIVIGKLLLTGCGFFAQTVEQKATCSVEAAFNVAAGPGPDVPTLSQISVN